MHHQRFVSQSPAESPSAKVGFVVSRSVGNAVTRNVVRRRLRHLMAARLGALPADARIVVRATPAAADRSYAELANTLDDLLARAAVAASTR